MKMVLAMKAEAIIYVRSSKIGNLKPKIEMVIDIEFHPCSVRYLCTAYVKV